MSFLHVAFLAGALTIAVPIVLHLIMRQQPKHLEFPALRFIKQRKRANRRQIRLRHWLLLALRCALLALLALALARPSIVTSGVLDQEAPVAAALVFDTNPRMQYRQQNKTRLEVAQATADWLLTQFPPESDVAVIDSRNATGAFAVDLGAARQRIERLDANLMPQPLSAAIDSALSLVDESDRPRKEIYIFTDLSRAAWSAEAMSAVGKRLATAPEVGFYLIDVGVIDPVNFGLGELRLSGDVLSRTARWGSRAIWCTRARPASARSRCFWSIAKPVRRKSAAAPRSRFSPTCESRPIFGCAAWSPAFIRAI